MIKICAYCKTEFKGKPNRKYCSVICSSKVNSAKNWKNGAYINRYGKERAKEIIEKQVNSLKNHPRKHELAVERGKANGVKMLGKTMEEIHGKEKANEIKKSISNTLNSRTPEEKYEHGIKGAIATMNKYRTVKGKVGYINDIRYDSSYEKT